MSTLAHEQPSAATARRVPPGPRGLPGIGVAHHLLRDLFEYPPRLAREYGDVVRIPVGVAPLVLVSHPDYVNHVFNRNTSRYAHSHEVMDLSILPGDPRPLPALDGPEWKRHRRVMQPHFTDKALVHVSDLIGAAITESVEDWERFAGTGEAIELQDEFGVVTMSTLMRSMFSSALDRRQIEEWVRQARIHGEFFTRGLATAFVLTRLPYGGLIQERVPWPHLVKGRANYKAMKVTLDAIIAQRRAHPIDDDDVLNMMLNSTFDDGTTFTHDELRSELTALMFAGFDTTAAALSWAIALLVRNPDQLADAYAEVDALGDGPIEPGRLAELPFLRACFDEAQRIQGGPFNGRLALQDDEIGGYHIKEGTFVVASMYGMHHDPRFWKDPEEFRPRRFLDDEIDKYAFLPFGVGPRRCVGVRMAYVAGVLSLATVLQRYRFELPDDWEPRRQWKLTTVLADLPVTVHHR